MEYRAGFLEDEVIEGYRVDREVKGIWAVYLELLTVFQTFCEDHGLQFFIGFGTLLGAVRYRGFVPWDDDIDIVMFREDFERLEELAGDVPSPYALLSPDLAPGFWHRGMMKFCHGGTSCIERRDRLQRFPQGISLEILPLDAVPEDASLCVEQFRDNAILQKLLWMRRYGNANDVSTEWTPYRWVGSLFSETHLRQRIKENATRYNVGPQKYLSMFTNWGPRFKVFHAEDFATAERLPFEGLSLPAPAGYERCLRIHYGASYRQPPPEERKRPKHPAYWSSEIPWRESLRQINGWNRMTAGKVIVLFGAGHMVGEYLRRTGKDLRPEFLVDNDERKWGTACHGFEVRKPDALLEIPPGKLHLVICNNYFRPIARQLRGMGIQRYFIFPDNWNVLFCPVNEISKYR